MQANPIHPISLEKARKELREQLAANAKLDLNKHFEGTGGGLPIKDGDRELEEQLERLWSEAEEKLMGLLIVDDLRAWVPDGDNWKLLPPRAMVRRATGPGDEPSGVYVDRHELAAALENRWPGRFEDLTPPSPQNAGKRKESTKPRGRPRGSGIDDTDLLDEMEEWKKADPSLSTPTLALMVVDRAEGTSKIEHRVRRLCRKFDARQNEGG